MLNFSYANATGGNQFVSLPNDFIEMRNLYLDTNPEQPLNYLSPSTFTRNARTQESGKPINYTVLSTVIQLAPVPDANYTLNMLYYAAPTFLSDGTNTNAFMTTCPDLLLYGALSEAEPYLMNDARLAIWAGMYSRALDDLTRSDDGGEYSGNPMVMTVAKR